MRDRINVLHPITRMIVGGAQLNTLYTCRLLDPERFRATLLTGPELGPEGDLLTTARKEVPTVLVPTLGREIHPFRDFRAYRDILAHLNQTPYEVVHTHTSKAGILGRLAARRCGVPVIIHTAHGWQWTLARNAAMRRFIVDCERWAARFTDRIVVVSEGDREKGLREGVGRPEQYTVIESAIPLDEFDPERVPFRDVRQELGIPDNGVVAGTVGRFSHPKEPEVMLRSAARILERREDAHFIYVGDGPDREAVLSRLGVLRDHPRLHLVGLRRDIPRLLAGMDVFLLSSSSEGLPRVIVEAMAMKKPVVSTPAGSVPDLVDEGTGRLVPFGSDESLSEAALMFLGDPNLAAAAGERGQRRVRERFGVEGMVHRIAALYDQVVEEKGVR